MVCIDSNILIYSAHPNKQWLRKWLSQQKLAVSSISKIEVLGYHKITAHEIRWTNHYFSICEILPLNNSVIESSIRLRQQKSMSLADAIIAATALTNSLPLLTGNTKDFKHIKSLDLIGLDDIRK